MERTATKDQAKSKQQLVQELVLLREKEKALKEAENKHLKAESELQRVNRALETVSACQKVLVQSKDKAELFQELSPTRDVAISVAWGLYGILLLGLGMARGRTGLRWLSLTVLILALFKAFLYDLDHLEGLYRVASLLGLALLLLAVSLLYQRFVFPRERATAG